MRNHNPRIGKMRRYESFAEACRVALQKRNGGGWGRVLPKGAYSG